MQSNFTLLMSKFFPAKNPFFKLQKKNLAGKNLLCKGTRSFSALSYFKIFFTKFLKKANLRKLKKLKNSSKAPINSASFSSIAFKIHCNFFITISLINSKYTFFVMKPIWKCWIYENGSFINEDNYGFCVHC